MWTFSAMLKNEIPIYFPLFARTFKVFIYLYQHSYTYIKVFMISSTKNIFFNLSVLLYVFLLTVYLLFLFRPPVPHGHSHWARFWFSSVSSCNLKIFFLLLSRRNCCKFWKQILTAVTACCKSVTWSRKLLTNLNDDLNLLNFVSDQSEWLQSILSMNARWLNAERQLKSAILGLCNSVLQLLKNIL